MKILFYRYGSICELAILRAFINFGYTVIEETTGINKPYVPETEQLHLLRTHFSNDNFQMVFSINFFPTISDVCNIIKIPYVCWIVDSPVLELYSYSISNIWNRIFIFDKTLYQEFLPKNPDNIFYLPLAADTEHTDLILSSITNSDYDKYQADVSFIGSLYSEKCPYNKATNLPPYIKGYLDGIIAAQEKVYGYYFIDELLTDNIIKEFKEHVSFYQFPEKANKNDKEVLSLLYLANKITEQERIHLLQALSKHFKVDIYTFHDTPMLPLIRNHGSASSDVEMPKIFHLSKINLNMTAKAIRSGIPLRIWDILGSNGFLITNYQKELEDYFKIGVDLEIYESEKDLIEKIQFFLAHSGLRKKIAANGYQKVLTYHTYQQRLQQILKMVFPH